MQRERVMSNNCEIKLVVLSVSVLRHAVRLLILYLVSLFFSFIYRWCLAGWMRYFVRGIRSERPRHGQSTWHMWAPSHFFELGFVPCQTNFWIILQPNSWGLYRRSPRRELLHWCYGRLPALVEATLASSWCMFAPLYHKVFDASSNVPFYLVDCMYPFFASNFVLPTQPLGVLIFLPAP